MGYFFVLPVVGGRAAVMLFMGDGERSKSALMAYCVPHLLYYLPKQSLPNQEGEPLCKLFCMSSLGGCCLLFLSPWWLCCSHCLGCSFACGFGQRFSECCGLFALTRSEASPPSGMVGGGFLLASKVNRRWWLQEEAVQKSRKGCSLVAPMWWQKIQEYEKGNKIRWLPCVGRRVSAGGRHMLILLKNCGILRGKTGCFALAGRKRKEVGANRLFRPLPATKL